MTMTAAERLESAHNLHIARTRTYTTSDPSGEQETVEEEEDSGTYVSKNEKGWRRVIRNFSPSWFSVTMGTGIVSTIFFAIPWKAHWLYYLSIIFFVLNVCLFSAAFIISVLRYSIWPGEYRAIRPA